MWDVVVDLLLDLAVPWSWRDKDGNVCVRWYILGFLLAVAIVVGLVLGVMYLMGMH